MFLVQKGPSSAAKQIVRLKVLSPYPPFQGVVMNLQSILLETLASQLPCYRGKRCTFPQNVSSFGHDIQWFGALNPQDRLTKRLLWYDR